MKFNRFRAHFLILFIALSLMSLLIIFFELALTFFSAYQAARSWPEYAAREYVESVEKKLNESINITPDRMIQAIVSNVNDRISGIIIRDSSGQAQILYGLLPNGKKSQNSIFDKSLIDSEYKIKSYSNINSTHTFSKKVRVYEYNIDLAENGSYHFYVNEYEEKEKREYVVPAEVKPNDIACTIIIKSNGSIKGYYDVLVMTATTYGPTKYLIETTVLILLLFIPIAFVFALIISFFVSKREEKSIKEIQRAIKKLSKNEFDIDISKQKSFELEDISESIRELSTILELHQKSRREWIRSISHDLNTPLTSLNMLLDGVIDNVFPNNIETLNSMKKECLLLSSRVNSIKYYAYLLSPDCTTSLSEVSARLLYDDIKRVYDNERLIITYDDVTYLVDHALLLRAIKEVVDNALSTDSEKVVVNLSSNLIKVVNKGKLYTPLPDFFEPWARGDYSRHSGGCGLGLPIVGQIMRLHKGKASIYQEDDNVVVLLELYNSSENNTDKS